MTKITRLFAREIIDSRGNPTIEVDCVIDNEFFGRAAAPSGASTGKFEALELRDKDPKRFNGKGVLIAINNLEKIVCPKLIGQEIKELSELDKILIELDGTENKSHLGANLTLAVSIAAAKALAAKNKIPLYRFLSDDNRVVLPKPMLNILNGGKHANNSLSIQEFMIIPQADKIKDNIRIGAEIFHNLARILHNHGYNTTVGDEGGYGPNLANEHEAFEMILDAISASGYQIQKDVSLAIDVAASEIYQNNHYQLNKELLTSASLNEFYYKLCQDYPIVSMEDPLAEEDYEAWQELTNKLGNTVQIVGDDLFVTNPKLLQKGIDEKLANAILIKPNQIGTLSETIETINLAKQAGFNYIISHRSGETEESWLSHLAVGFAASQIKTGSLCRGERTAKYNELLRISEEING